MKAAQDDFPMTLVAEVRGSLALSALSVLAGMLLCAAPIPTWGWAALRIFLQF